MSAAPCARPKLQEWRQAPAAGGSTTPVESDFSIYQGDGFSYVIEVLAPDGTPLDLSAYSVLAQIRHGPADLFPEVVATFSTAVLPPNMISLILLPEQTAVLVSDDPYFFDVEISSAGVPTTLVRGRIIVTLEISG